MTASLSLNTPGGRQVFFGSRLEKRENDPLNHTKPHEILFVNFRVISWIVFLSEQAKIWGRTQILNTTQMALANTANLLYDSLLALVYPQSCAVCGDSVESRADGVACEKCWRQTRLFTQTETLCWKCGLP